MGNLDTDSELLLARTAHTAAHNILTSMLSQAKHDLLTGTTACEDDCKRVVKSFEMIADGLFKKMKADYEAVLAKVKTTEPVGHS